MVANSCYNSRLTDLALRIEHWAVPPPLLDAIIRSRSGPPLRAFATRRTIELRRSQLTISQAAVPLSV